MAHPDNAGLAAQAEPAQLEGSLFVQVVGDWETLRSHFDPGPRLNSASREERLFFDASTPWPPGTALVVLWAVF